MIFIHLIFVDMFLVYTKYTSLRAALAGHIALAQLLSNGALVFGD
jgi:hypothetical protein